MDINRREALIGGFGVLGGGFLGGYGVDKLGGDNSESPEDQVSFGLSKSPVIGSDDAPVKLLYWVDFQCPFCYRFSQNQFGLIYDEFISSGQVQMVLKPLTIFGEDSFRSAVSMHCVNSVSEGGAVLDWYKQLHELYNEASGRNTGWAEYSQLVDEAGKFDSVSVSKLRSCLSNSDYRSQIRDEYETGEGLGLRGPPVRVG
jgi:protein-disulfide isomerase